MKIYSRLLFLILLTGIIQENVQSQTTEVFLITCSPGTETYSMYGHSALRLVDSVSNIDLVYNWGVFDFNTPNFNYKFAKGRLNYKLAISSYKKFLQDYFLEKRSVYSQQIFLDEETILSLKVFLSENIKEENKYYKYDFLKDNCSTRIRDLLETILSGKLIYPKADDKESASYRSRLKEYQLGMPWLDAGIDFLIGSPGDDYCDFRSSMFLPDYLMWNMSEVKYLSSEGEKYLLGPIETVFEFDRLEVNKSFLAQPWFQLSIIVLLIFFFTFLSRNRVLQSIFDQVFFTILMVLSFLMIFTNYMTDHVAMGNNFNMVWLNPLLIVSPFLIFTRHQNRMFWSAIISLEILFMILSLFIKQSMNPVFIPLLLIIIIRTYYRMSSK